MVNVLVVVCALACVALLLSERSASRLGVWVSKPIAAAAFVGVGLAAGGLDSAYGQWVVLGLCLSWLGDVLLIPIERDTLFLLGIASFLCAHLAYCMAFLSAGLSLAGLVGCAVLAIPAALGLLSWLRPHLGGVFAFAVRGYIGVIGAMLCLAVSAALASAWLLPALGAFLFAASDVSVARERFVSPGFENAAWGLPVYFGAQILLALSVSGLPSSPVT